MVINVDCRATTGIRLSLTTQCARNTYRRGIFVYPLRAVDIPGNGVSSFLAIHADAIAAIRSIFHVVYNNGEGHFTTLR